MKFNRNPLALAVVYTAVSLGIEALLIGVFKLRVPEDNRILAAVVLTVPPIVAPLLCGFRRPKALLLAAVWASLLTLVFTVAVTSLSGIVTGIAQPLLVRFAAGFLAAKLTNLLAPEGAPGKPVG